MESYKLLRDLIKFNTIQDKENKKIIEYLEKSWIQNGIQRKISYM